jgi:uncharacterized membrane protein
MLTIDNLLFALKLASVLCCGAMAGFFLAFSNTVMAALARIQQPQGIAAMQSVNIVVLNPLFFTFFFGTAVVCLALIAFSILRWQQPDGVYLLVGGLLYLIGTILVTIMFNVPLNETLARVEPESADAAALWTRYLSNWTMWNHVRTAAALLATVSFAIAFYYRTAQ